MVSGSQKNRSKSLAGPSRFLKKPGLGIEIDPERLEFAHKAYLSLADGARDDGAAMQFLMPGWKFDPKRPSLVR